MHHRILRSTSTPGPLESVLEALEQLRHCGSAIEWIVAADSALQKGLVTRRQLETLFGGSTRDRRLLARVDARSESGTETIVRVALRSAGVRLRPQVTIEGVGRVDMLIGDRLVVEVDGYAWHGDRRSFEEDRRRDLALMMRGYAVVRLSYRRVVEDWTAVEHDLRELVRRGEHRWRGRHGAKNDAAIASPASPGRR